jgi:hypothetical protein
VIAFANQLRDRQQQPDNDHHRRDHPQVFRERPLNQFLKN